MSHVVPKTRSPRFSDPRQETYQNRLDIGFLPSYGSWKKAQALKTPSTLTINNHPVMEDWERGYMKALASIAGVAGGRVLEVGFGLGISAAYLQEFPLSEHVIIEANDDVYSDAILFARSAKRKTTPLLGFWQEVTQTLEDNSFDGILFDTYPLTPEEIHRNHFDFFAEAYRLLKPAGTLTYYSDEMDNFSDEHYALLARTGFRSIDKDICVVEPPEHCLYWKSSTILAPKITK